MRTLVHLSDIHFGAVDCTLIDPLVAQIVQIKPHVVVVSGDLTQRARASQFREARRFLDRLPKPQIVVPGNHDVPLYNIFARFFHPLRNFQRYITDDLEPLYADDEIAVAGINTARSLTFKGGRINEEQIANARDRLCSLGAAVKKVIATHHPFDIPADHGEHELVGRARAAMEMFAKCGADLLLAGHLHVSHTESTAERYRISGFSAIVVQAGTATSKRERGESNSFNVIHIDDRHIAVERWTWQREQGVFARCDTDRYEQPGETWNRVA